MTAGAAVREQLRRLARNGPAVWAIVIVAAMACGTLMAFDTPAAEFLRLAFRIVSIGFVVFMLAALIRNRAAASRGRR